MSFFKRWIRWQIRYFASLVVIGLSIVAFGGLAVTFWPDYAWGTTALFTLIIIWVVSRYEPRTK